MSQPISDAFAPALARLHLTVRAARQQRELEEAYNKREAIERIGQARFERALRAWSQADARVLVHRSFGAWGRVRMAAAPTTPVEEAPAGGTCGGPPEAVGDHGVSCKATDATSSRARYWLPKPCTQLWPSGQGSWMTWRTRPQPLGLRSFSLAFSLRQSLPLGPLATFNNCEDLVFLQL